MSFMGGNFQSPAVIFWHGVGMSFSSSVFSYSIDGLDDPSLDLGKGESAESWPQTELNRFLGHWTGSEPKLLRLPATRSIISISLSAKQVWDTMLKCNVMSFHQVVITFRVSIDGWNSHHISLTD